MKEPGNLIDQPDLTKREMHETFMQTSWPASTKAFIERVVKVTNSTNEKADLDKFAAAAVQLDLKNTKIY